MSYAATCHKVVHQADVDTAFLNAVLNEEIYIELPPGLHLLSDLQSDLIPLSKLVTLSKKTGRPIVGVLLKALYGLKQAPRQWRLELASKLKLLGFHPLYSDPGAYIRKEGSDVQILLIYVDDLIIIASNVEKVEKFKKDLSTYFKIKDLGRCKKVIGIECDQKGNKFYLSQSNMIHNLIEKFSVQEPPTKIPMSLEYVKEREINMKDDPTLESSKKELFQSIVGSLIYLSICTRPDISYSVSKLCKNMSNPTETDLKAAYKVLRYLKGTAQQPLIIGGGKLELMGYSDSSFADDPSTRRSTSGYLFQFGGGSISWRTTQQKLVALSTAEAEYISLAIASQEGVFLSQLITELSLIPSSQENKIANLSVQGKDDYDSS